ncbi:hypothetical protein, partial [Rhodanobacter lindaniclasticus]
MRMPSGVTPSATAIIGTAVLTTVESSDCMKNAAATSHSRPRKRSRVDGSGKAAETVAAGASAVAGLAMAGMIP